MSIGSNNDATANYAAAFGFDNTVSAANAFALGKGIINATAGSLMFGPSNTAKVTILSSGNMGVGSDSPQAKLHLAGGLIVGINNADPVLAAPSGAFISSRVTRNNTDNSSGTVWYKFATLPPSNGGNGAFLNVEFVGGSSASIDKHKISIMVATRDAVTARIISAAGKSTTLSSSGVVVYQESTGYSLYVKLAGSQFTAGQITAADGSWGWGASFFEMVNGSPTNLTTPPGTLVFDSTDLNNYQGLFVDYNNNRVGLGTTTPGQKLEVAGNIKLTGNIITPTGTLSLPTSATGTLVSSSGPTTMGGSSAATQLKIDGTTGNVGIGIAPSSAKLDVSGSANITGDFSVVGTTRSNTSLTNNSIQRHSWRHFAYGLGGGTTSDTAWKKVARFQPRNTTFSGIAFEGRVYDHRNNSGADRGVYVPFSGFVAGSSDTATITQGFAEHQYVRIIRIGARDFELQFRQPVAWRWMEAEWRVTGDYQGGETITYYDAAALVDGTTASSDIYNPTYDTYNSVGTLWAGTIGIGTANPTGKLHVKQDSIPSIFDRNGTGQQISIITNAGGNTIKADSIIAGTKDFILTTGGSSAGNIGFEPAGSRAVTITTAGNVGIGFPAPAAKLDVNGTVQIAGDVTIKNVGATKSVIRISPAGDIGMGAFLSGTNPNP